MCSTMEQPPPLAVSPSPPRVRILSVNRMEEKHRKLCHEIDQKKYPQMIHPDRISKKQSALVLILVEKKIKTWLDIT